MYVAVKGGERAIENAHRLLAKERRGDAAVPELSLEQISGQLSLAVDRVMGEGSLYDPELAALAVKQARGDMVEAIFLLRAYRTTLPRFGASVPLDTGAMRIRRRISAIFKDLPGGQKLGPTFDYTHRLLDWDLARTGAETEAPASAQPEDAGSCPKALEFLTQEGILEQSAESEAEPGDLTRDPLTLPAGRAVRLQNLARGDEGFVLSLGYSSQRGFGATHPFVGEIRMGEVEAEFCPEELGFAVTVGAVSLTECETVNQFIGKNGREAMFTRGYGLVFGGCERKAIAMALVDRALRGAELGEEVRGPAQDEEFVLYHSDNVEASGFVQHLKLPHYVDFQAELSLVRGLRAETEEAPDAA